MSFPTKRRDWKRVRPTSLREAFRLCIEYARDRKNLSVDRIADLMGISVDLLYKYLADGSMKAREIRVFEGLCGVSFVTGHLAASDSRIVIEIPTGRVADALEINDLQAVIADAMGLLIRFYGGDADQAATEAGLTEILVGVAWHRENVHKAAQPELERRYLALRARLESLHGAEVTDIELAMLELAIGDMESLLNVLSPPRKNDEE